TAVHDLLRRRKPSLIYASASGYGPDGPYSQRPGQDLLAQALFGLMAITGQRASGPRPVGVSAVDHHGAVGFAMGILAALLRREPTGQGCRVDASLMQAALDLQAESLTEIVEKLRTKLGVIAVRSGKTGQASNRRVAVLTTPGSTPGAIAAKAATSFDCDGGI